MENLHLASRLREDDPNAFEEVFKKFQPKVYQYTLRYVRLPYLAKELTQQLFVRLWEKRATISVDKPLEAQIFFIARNLAIDELRRVARDRHIKDLYAYEKEIATELNVDSEDASQLKQILETAVSELPTRGQQVFKMSRINGMTYKEIAEELSISNKTVETLMSRSLKSLRVKLSGFLSGFL